jgi:hypothetical protein
MFTVMMDSIWWELDAGPFLFVRLSSTCLRRESKKERLVLERMDMSLLLLLRLRFVNSPCGCHVCFHPHLLILLLEKKKKGLLLLGRGKGDSFLLRSSPKYLANSWFYLLVAVVGHYHHRLAAAADVLVLVVVVSSQQQ